MRAVLFGDIEAAARALLNCPPDAREDLCDRIVAEAGLADRYVRRMGRLHPLWGNGTLRDAARRYGSPPAPGFDDRSYCTCFGLVLKALCHRREKPSM